MLFIKMLLAGLPWASYVRAKLATFAGERGQDIMEYAVLAGAIALVIGAILFGTDMAGAVDDFAGGVMDCINMSGDCGGDGGGE